MFVQYKFIAEQHKVALQGVLAHGVSAARLAALYEATLAVLDAEDTAKLSLAANFAFSRLVTETHVIAVVTTRDTGVYCQLAREKTKPQAYLTVGQKWAMEQPGPHSVNTVFW